MGPRASLNSVGAFLVGAKFAMFDSDPIPPIQRSGPFRRGEHVQLLDRRGRSYLVQLSADNLFESHIGNYRAAGLIGQNEGCWIVTNKGHRLLAVRPTLSDLTLRMPRIATVMYPKDLGAMLVYADIFPGARVLEAGAGSGAVTMSLLRAVGDTGRVFTYDVRQDMIDQATANIARYFERWDSLELKIGDVYEGFDEHDLDRIVLDLPEPWHVVPHASDRMVPGGVFFGFVPTVPQVDDLVRSLRAQRTFAMIETMEIMMRQWNVSGRSVRPSHRMVGHTGFIVTARRTSPRQQPEDGDDPKTNAA